MCGIGGLRTFNKAVAPILPEQVTALLLALERRGKDASGIGFGFEDGSFVVLKEDCAATAFCMRPQVLTFLEEHLTSPNAPIVALVHTRAVTKGPSRFNANNHPLTGDRVALVHNGVIGNDDALFAQTQLARRAETDSDILRALVEEPGFTPKGIRQLERANGSCAAALLHTAHPGELLLLRAGNPLFIGASEHQLLWASTELALHLASSEYITRFGITLRRVNRGLAISPMPEDSAWVIGETGLLRHQPLKLQSYCRPRLVLNSLPEGSPIDQEPLQPGNVLGFFCKALKCNTIIKVSILESWKGMFPSEIEASCPTCRLRQRMRGTFKLPDVKEAHADARDSG